MEKLPKELIYLIFKYVSKKDKLSFIISINIFEIRDPNCILLY